MDGGEDGSYGVCAARRTAFEFGRDLARRQLDLGRKSNANMLMRAWKRTAEDLDVEHSALQLLK
jgi:hypothetical protein